MSKQYWLEACNLSVTDPRLARATTEWGVAVVSANTSAALAVKIRGGAYNSLVG